MEDIHNKLKNLKDFIKSKTDLGTTNYIMKEINEVCGMVETEQLCQYNVVGRSEQLRAFKAFLQSEYHLPISNRMVDEFEQKQSS